jgi:hypothetical protein
MCNDCEKTPTCFETKKCEPCKAPISTSCLYYNLENQESSHLLALGVENGTPLNTILEQLTKKVNLVATPNFTSFTIPYLKGKSTVTNIKQFSELVSLELGNLNAKAASSTACCTENREAVASMSLDVNAIKFPKIQDTSIAGFTVNSTINVVLQKLSNQIATLNGAAVVSPPIIPNETSSIKINKSGILGHTISATVKRSGAAGNQIRLNPDGLYVPPYVAANQTQALSGNGNTITLTSGGSYTVPIPSLTLNGTTIGIAGSPVTYNLASIFASTAFTLASNNTSSVTTTITGTTAKIIQSTVNRSGDSGNVLEIRPTGLFVPVNGAQAVLTEINESAPNSTLRQTFCSIQAASCRMCFSFYIKNTSGILQNFKYVNCNGTLIGVDIAAGQSRYLTDVRRVPGTEPITGFYTITCLGLNT